MYDQINDRASASSNLKNTAGIQQPPRVTNLTTRSHITKPPASSEQHSSLGKQAGASRLFVHKIHLNPYIFSCTRFSSPPLMSLRRETCGTSTDFVSTQEPKLCNGGFMGPRIPSGTRLPGRSPGTS